VSIRFVPRVPEEQKEICREGGKRGGEGREGREGRRESGTRKKDKKGNRKLGGGEIRLIGG